jgi:hypothetical protein
MRRLGEKPLPADVVEFEFRATFHHGFRTKER